MTPIVPEDAEWNEDLERRERLRRAEDEERFRQVSATPGLLTGVPTWMKAAAYLGVPTLISLFLVWQEALRLPKIEDSITKLEQMLELQVQQGALRDAKQDQILRTLQGICVNTAKTDDDRRRCF